MAFYGARLLEANCAGPDLRTGRGPAQAWHRPGLRFGVGCGRREGGGAPSGPLHLRGCAPGAVRHHARAADIERAEGGDPEVRAAMSCAPLTPMSWSDWRRAMTRSK